MAFYSVITWRGAKIVFVFICLYFFFLHWKKVFVADKSDVFLFCFFEL